MRMRPVAARWACKWGLALLPALAAPGLSTAQAPAQPAAWVLGQTLSLSGPHARLGQALLRGRQACVDAVNREGGIGGRTLRLVTLDDGGRPERALANVQTLLQTEQAVALLGAMGAAINPGLLRETARQGVLVLAPFGGDVATRARPPEGVVFITANQSAEAEHLVRHLSSTGVSQVAVVASNDDTGQSALSALEEALSVAGIPAGLTLGVDPDGRGVQAAAARLRQAPPQALLLATSGLATARLLRELGSASGALQVYGMSATASLEDLRSLQGLGRGLAMTQVLPSINDPHLPLLAQFRQAMQSARVEAGHVELEGCVSVLTFAAVLRAQRSLPAPHRSAVLQAFRSTSRVRVGGLEVPLDPRASGRFVDIVYIGADTRVLR